MKKRLATHWIWDDWRCSHRLISHPYHSAKLRVARVAWKKGKKTEQIYFFHSLHREYIFFNILYIMLDVTLLLGRPKEIFRNLGKGDKSLLSPTLSLPLRGFVNYVSQRCAGFVSWFWNFGALKWWISLVFVSNNPRDANFTGNYERSAENKF